MIGFCRGKVRIVFGVLISISFVLYLLTLAVLPPKVVRKIRHYKLQYLQKPKPHTTGGTISLLDEKHSIAKKSNDQNDDIDSEKYPPIRYVETQEDSMLFKNQRCKYPKLDPFDPAVMKKSAKPDILKKCSWKRYGTMEGNILHLDVRDLKLASIRYIRRTSDFHSSNSNPELIFQEGSAQEVELKPCWIECGGHGGRCPGHCGKEGYCCRRNFKDCPDEVSAFAPVDGHGCTTKGTEVLDYKVKEDYFRLYLTTKSGHQLSEYHVAYLNPDSASEKKNSTNDRPNIIMIHVDAVSDANMQRNAPRVYSFLDNHPNTVILRNHSIVGDGTTAQVAAILTGVPEKELPDARRSIRNTKSVDDWPWLFKELHEMNYKTLYSEEEPQMGTFQFRLHGWRNVPTTHYQRTIWLSMWPEMAKIPLCALQFHMDSLRRFMNTYRNENKFAMYILSLMSHEKQENLVNMEDDLLQMYKDLHDDGHLDNTVVFLYGDHGSRASTFRDTLQGKIEERAPFMAITFPPKFNKYKDLVTNLKRNSRVMTTHFDIHSTLHHITTFPHENAKHTNTKYGRTLFSDLVQHNRTCEEVAIEPHWCLCLRFESIPKEDIAVKNITHYVITYINTLNNKHADGKCHTLTLKSITKASRNIPNKEVQRYVSTSKNKECDACIINYDKNIKVNRYTYQVVFEVNPSEGIYEATIVCTVEGGLVSNCGIPEVSRLNLYGHQPDCIAQTIPMLRKFCYCR